MNEIISRQSASAIYKAISLVALTHAGIAAQAELAVYKREAASGRSPAKPRGRAGAEPSSDGNSGQVGSGPALRSDLEGARSKLAAAQAEAGELSTSLAKATSVIEVWHWSTITLS